MENKILDDVKVGIGLMPEYTAFDEILTIHINTVFTILTQLGVNLPVMLKFKCLSSNDGAKSSV